MKRIFPVILLMLASAPILRADEGMWLPALISQRIADMQAKGFKLSAEDVYSVNQASLKDAVVLLVPGALANSSLTKGFCSPTTIAATVTSRGTRASSTTISRTDSGL